jgi:putative iron-regulated protein
VVKVLSRADRANRTFGATIMRLNSRCLSLTAALGLTAVAAISTARAETDAAAVIDTYGDIGEAMYADALNAAKALQTTVDAFLAEPSDATQAAAKAAWKAARLPYQQTEGFRFGNAIVDDWEGRVNAWPLDEGLIDYVDADLYGEESPENPLYTANVVANAKIRIGPDVVDASVITPALISDTLQEAQGVEANVAAGYHAIEFLLWGQDLNGTDAGAGERPASDYDTANCTHGNCDRRAEYLKAATDLLVSDLAEMAGNWRAGGAARQQLAAKGEQGGLATILTGLGSLSYGELAGERMKLGLLLHDPEEEPDCFSDNTHNSHYYDEVGMAAIWRASYTRTDGSQVQGPSIRDYATEHAPEAAERVDAAFATTLAKMEVMKQTADSGQMAYDQMIAAGNDAGNAIVDAVIQSLVAQARAVEGAVSALDLSIELEGSDSLDDPAAVQ